MSNPFSFPPIFSTSSSKPFSPSGDYPFPLFSSSNPFSMSSSSDPLPAFRSNESIQTDACLQLTKHVGGLGHGQLTNFVFSPLSLHLTLSLVAIGCTGRSLDQMLSFLKSESVDQLNSVASRLVDSLRVTQNNKGPFRLSFVNGAWVERSLTLKPSFQHTVNTIYKAKAEAVDFKNKAEEARKQVNAWVKKETDGLIQDLLPFGSVNHSTGVILGNALYFKGFWNEKFHRSQTRTSAFHLLDGNSIQVPFMTSKVAQFISSFDGFKVLKLPYKRGDDARRFSMYILLPDQIDGLPNLIEKTSSEMGFLDHHLPIRKVNVGKFMVPRFKLSFEFEASEVLKKLGVVLPFSEVGAELTEMVEVSSLDGNLHIASIHHKSFVEVNEEGTEAAAATMAISNCFSGPPVPPMDFVADHPFMFMIREDVNGVALFIGHVVNPLVVE